MSGKGGYKHRRTRVERQASRKKKKARASIAKARAIFEAKGQAWDPKNNPTQLAALNHDGRRHVQRSDITKR